MIYNQNLHMCVCVCMCIRHCFPSNLAQHARSKSTTNICTNLRFRRPHQKQCKNFCGKSVDLNIPDWTASINIPKSKSVVFGGFIEHKLLRSVVFLNAWSSQWKALSSHPFTLRQAYCQQSISLWIEKKYQRAPST